MIIAAACVTDFPTPLKKAGLQLVGGVGCQSSREELAKAYQLTNPRKDIYLAYPSTEARLRFHFSKDEIINISLETTR